MKRLEVNLKGWVAGPGCGSGFKSGRNIGYFFKSGDSMHQQLSAGHYRPGDKVKVEVGGNVSVYAEVVGSEDRLFLCYNVYRRDCLDSFQPQEKVDITVKFLRRAA
jgi:hypothetical protein